MFKQPIDFWETYVAVQNEWPWMKSQLDLWWCFIMFNLSCKYYNFHLNRLEKHEHFKIFFQYNILGIKLALP